MILMNVINYNSGVGSFNNSMNFLNSKFNIDELVNVLRTKILGICVGMQIFAEYGYENEKTKGLSLIKGEVKKLKPTKSYHTLDLI